MNTALRIVEKKLLDIRAFNVTTEPVAPPQWDGLEIYVGTAVYPVARISVDDNLTVVSDLDGTQAKVVSGTATFAGTLATPAIVYAAVLPRLQRAAGVHQIGTQT